MTLAIIAVAHPPLGANVLILTPLALGDVDLNPQLDLRLHQMKHQVGTRPQPRAVLRHLQSIPAGQLLLKRDRLANPLQHLDRPCANANSIEAETIIVRENDHHAVATAHLVRPRLALREIGTLLLQLGLHRPIATETTTSPELHQQVLRAAATHLQPSHLQQALL